MTHFTPTTLTAVLVAALTAPALAGSVEVSFDGLTNGTPISRVDGMDIGVRNLNAGGGQVVQVFGYQDYPQFASGGHQTPFLGGNAAGLTPVNGIIVPGSTSFIEGNRPAADLFFNFDGPVTDFEFTIVDVDGPEEFQTDSGFFFDIVRDGNEVGRVFFGDLLTPGNAYYDSTVAFGNGFANTIGITAAELGVADFDRVELSLGGSASIARMSFSPVVAIPSPTAAVAGLSLLGLVGARRRRQA